VLCLKPAIARLETALLRCRDSAIALARAQRATPMLARTLMQSAGITTLGFKAVLWAHSLSAVHERVKKAAGNALAISLGGAIGNLSAFGGKGAALRAALADALGLIDPGTTWHAQRERLTGLGCDLGIACGVMTKIARDLSLMMQAEVGEAREPSSEGRGGSTAMPHKHNPLLTMRVLAASQALPGLVANLLAGMAQEHERALGNWQAEMDQHRMLVEHALAAAQALAELLEGLHIDPERCRANIDALHGIIFSEALTALFSPMLGKHQAQTLVAALCQKSVEEQRSLQQLVIEQLASDPALAAVGTGDVIAVFDVRNAARASEHETDRLLCALGTQSS
jgi:3-carboxy-cis,cis-muconate cycloisomerase